MPVLKMSIRQVVLAFETGLRGSGASILQSLSLSHWPCTVTQHRAQPLRPPPMLPVLAQECTSQLGCEAQDPRHLRDGGRNLSLTVSGAGLDYFPLKLWICCIVEE